MRKLVGFAVAVAALLLFAAAPAHALSVSTAALGGGQACTTASCSTATMNWSVSSGTGTGTLDLTASTLTFSISLPSSTFIASPGPDNGVTQIVFSDTTYTGSASVLGLGGGLFAIMGGSAAISGTQTPSGAGTAGAFSAASSLLSGSCFASSATNVSCGIIFSASNDFNFDVNGATRYFTHTLNVTAVPVTAVPEPATFALLGLGCFGLALARARSSV